MRNLRILLIAFVVVAAVTGITWLGYSLFQKFHRPAESPFNAIPGNTAMIIQLNKAGNLLEELNRSNLLWRALCRFPGINVVKNELQFVDSASRKNEKINKLFQQYNILISITLSGRNNFGALYLAKVSSSYPDAYISDFVQEISAGKTIITETPYYTTSLKRILFKGSHDAFYFSVFKGVFIGSFHADLVKRAIDRLSLHTPLATSTGFRKVEASAGKKVDANIYINYRFFSLVLSKMTRDENLPDLLKFSNFADWSGLDLIIKKDELLFNGVTVASDSSQQFLALFNDQKPQKKEITSIIPEKTLYFTTYGWSNPSRFCQRFQNRTPHDEVFSVEQTSANTLIDRFQLNISEYFLPWMGNEGALFALEDPKTAAEVTLTAFSSRDTLQTVPLLFALADTLGIKADSLQFNGHKIYRMELPAFVPALFGEIFGKVDVKCFTLLKGYVIFARQPRDLELVINAVSEGSTIAKDKPYKDFEANLPEKSNVFCYFSTRNALSSLKGIMNQDLSDQLSLVMDSLRKFESIAFQFSNADGQFYSNIFLRYNPNLDKEGPLEWQARLDTTIAGQPKIIPGSGSGDPAIVVSDVSNNLYYISGLGHIEWKLPIMGKMMGEIHPIRLAGNDSLYLLFNTDTHLYLLHANGRFADKFPMRFPLHATNGLTVANWDNDQDYHILVAFQDNRVYSFSLGGTSDISWKRPSPKEEIIDPVSFEMIGNKEFVLISGVTGNTMIVDRNGIPRITPGPKFLHAPSSKLYPNETNKKGEFITTDPDGKLVFLQQNGRLTEVTLNLFTREHRFFYEDISGNGKNEFIFIDHNKIYYYNYNFKLIYSYMFRHAISNPPFLLHNSNGKVMVGFVMPETNELFLFDKNGYRELESGIRGNTPFDIGKLEGRNTASLVVGAGKYLKSYRLAKQE
ncbi:MAG: DUF3352 domain-containing protein [Bacteroidota bacterium]